MKYKIIVGIILITLAGFLYLFFTKSSDEATPSQQSSPQSVSEKDPPIIVSTKPDPLEEAIVTTDQIIEITFNRSLENVGEFKLRIEPEIEIKVELSDDRKTARIIPLTPYELGTTYTMFIGTDTKFDGVGNWGTEKIFHFKTIKYTGV